MGSSSLLCDEPSMDRVADSDLADPNPDVGELFRHYNQLYFRGALDGFAVLWSSQRMTSSSGACTFGKAGNTITLSEPMLKYRPTDDLKNTLLHEMIHAVLFVKQEKRDHGSHGPSFRAWMDAINSCTIFDDQRPLCGYNITTRHDFHREQASIKGFQWKCESCGDLLLRAMNQGPPSDGCCIENVGNHKTCGNMLCHWHNHKMSCVGTYARTMNKTPQLPGQKRVSKGAQRHLGGTSKMLKSHETTQELASAGLQEKNPTKKSNAVGKLLSLVGSSNVKLLSSGFSKRDGKRHKPEEEAELQEKDPSRKSNAVGKLLSLVGGSNVKLLGSSSSKKDGKRHKPEEAQNTSALPAASPRKLEQENLVAPEKQVRMHKTKKSTKKKELIVVSVWLNYYESDGSSESVVPLVNKRTERRKRERNRMIYSRTRKRGAKGSNPSSAHPDTSRSNALAYCQNVKPHALQDVSPEQSQPPAPRLDNAVTAVADRVVLSQSAVPTDLIPAIQSTDPTIIDISDDD